MNHTMNFTNWTASCDLDQAIKYPENMLCMSHDVNHPDWIIDGGLNFEASLEGALPAGLHVYGDFHAKNRKELTSLPEGLHIEGSLYLQGCENLTELPDGLHVGETIHLQGTSVKTLPPGFINEGSLNLAKTSVVNLPDRLVVGECLCLQGSMVTKLPDNMTVGIRLWNPYDPYDSCENITLNLRDTEITELPKNLTLYGELALGETSITKLSKGLKVIGNLNLLSTSIVLKNIPNDFYIMEGDVFVDEPEIEYVREDKLMYATPLF